jgi:hypothetical protein
MGWYPIARFWVTSPYTTNPGICSTSTSAPSVSACPGCHLPSVSTPYALLYVPLLAYENTSPHCMPSDASRLASRTRCHAHRDCGCTRSYRDVLKMLLDVSTITRPVLCTV